MPVRLPAVAGLFYPDDPAALTDAVDRLLQAAPPPAVTGARAVIAPHAGYVYSGSTAAVAYRALGTAPSPSGPSRVAVLGPTHRVPVRGIAVPRTRRWRTPLGDLAVDIPAGLLDLDAVVETDAPHAPEHSIEVHLPFVQRLLGDVPVLPLAVGRADEHQVADAIDLLLDDPGTLVVVSSDLSHYLPYADAHRLDEATLAQVTGLRGTIDHGQACGATPVNGLVEHARRRGRGLRLLAACNSGDTAGDRGRVVGYAALALTD